MAQQAYIFAKSVRIFRARTTQRYIAYMTADSISLPVNRGFWCYCMYTILAYWSGVAENIFIPRIPRLFRTNNVNWNFLTLQNDSVGRIAVTHFHTEVIFRHTLMYSMRTRGKLRESCTIPLFRHTHNPVDISTKLVREFGVLQTKGNGAS